MPYNRIIFLKVPFIRPLTLMAIFRALKDKRRVLVWGKGITSELEGIYHEKGCGLMRAFVTGKGSVEVLVGKVNGERG